MLVSAGATTQVTVKNALKMQRRDRRPLGEILIGLGVASDQVTTELGRQMGLTAIDLDAVAASHEAIDSITAEFARENQVFPYHIDDTGRLHVASGQPQRRGAGGAGCSRLPSGRCGWSSPTRSRCAARSTATTRC